jgi:hypothetical protein
MNKLAKLALIAILVPVAIVAALYYYYQQPDYTITLFANDDDN